MIFFPAIIYDSSTEYHKIFENLGNPFLIKFIEVMVNKI